ncbi:hypothetical protein CLV35_2468 [Motilibacter peucedani]|uniref:Uncharacterized protein n=1 Tax=Motilibacter peucedani TaxID=598650 RepID=A0A420XP42_9ACTN|nr:C4-type zinc ribbon domain-containing protein [Motilibacter peucedani]RKS73971.1 hypothetical protein CLV35_2468 [Motilibacter peucedani]
MKADPSEQLRLLDLQALDTRLDQLEHRRHSMPELAEIAALDKELAHLRNLLVAAETQLSDLERERARAETDVEQVRTRVRRDRDRMDSGRITNSKELVELSSELESLARRQSVLEDVELEVMERIEVSSAEHQRVSVDVAAVEEKRAAAAGRRDAVLAEVDGEAALTTSAREAVVRDIGPQLLALYDKVRASSGGLGAAELKARRCQGCRLELNTVDLSTFRDAAPDEVLRCEECRRILVRTPESGL